jgi:hypothetical protein
MSAWTQWAYGNPIDVQVQQDKPYSGNLIQPVIPALVKGNEHEKPSKGACCFENSCSAHRATAQREEDSALFLKVIWNAAGQAAGCRGQNEREKSKTSPNLRNRESGSVIKS